MDQALLFEHEICSPSLVLYLQCPETVMVSRLIDRSATSGRFDDNMETIQKRLRTFDDISLPVIRHYMEEDKVMKVNSANNLADVYLDLEKSLKERGLVMHQPKSEI